MRNVPKGNTYEYITMSIRGSINRNNWFEVRQSNIGELAIHLSTKFVYIPELKTHTFLNVNSCTSDN